MRTLELFTVKCSVFFAAALGTRPALPDTGCSEGQLLTLLPREHRYQYAIGVLNTPVFLRCDDLYGYTSYLREIVLRTGACCPSGYSIKQHLILHLDNG
ncbi:hypothetical protein PHLGIDRAFT_166514 [Phlebiopsis gigantea 11061_1 CR5-6]|uniref:Uncharacterized protein n=1 Tax=Phlebiopsis gigantea (strain 11061_1 CR5-6) TaxID=745531 RepID=A0A0C3S4N9_PHLG1|nr:hypothetical protein PHLGIDRAFT_166514 [Phlebiopsis gigantea 11061_1 CR5-6]